MTRQTDGPNQFLTAPEAADLLRTSPAGIYKMVQRGQLPGVVRWRRRILIDRVTLVDWLRQNRTRSSAGDER